VLRKHRLFAGLHEHEAARAVSILGHARREARLPEQGRLLVAGDARHRDAPPAEQPAVWPYTSDDAFTSGSMARGTSRMSSSSSSHLRSKML
jgi:hypothetical protein